MRSAKTPDGLNMRVPLMLAVLGALVCLVGWFRVFS